MSKPQSALVEHQLEWNERLQDWLDGELDAAQRPGLTAHLAACVICQQQLGDLEQLEGALRTATAQPSLDSSFDARLYAQIGISSEVQRAAARQRIEQEMQRDLRLLAHQWRRALAFIVPGIVAGIALAFALASYFDSSGVTGAIVAQSGGEFGSQAADLTRIFFMTLTGAAIGAVVAGWMARAAE